MKKALIASILAAAVVVAGGVAFAQQNNKDKGKPAGGGAGGYQKVKTYDFTGDTIDGDLIKPDGELIDVRGTVQHTKLIKVRQDFIKEIIKSAEDL